MEPTVLISFEEGGSVVISVGIAVSSAVGKGDSVVVMEELVDIVIAVGVSVGAIPVQSYYTALILYISR